MTSTIRRSRCANNGNTRSSKPKIEQQLQPELASAGAEGWELVSVTAMFNTMMTKVVYTLFLKRPVS